MTILIISILLACTPNYALSPTIESVDTQVVSTSATPPVLPVSLETSTVMVPSLTPLPTFNQDNARQILTQFVQENGGCKLPCILGIDPANSDLTSIGMFTEYFQIHSQDSDDQMNGLYIDSYRIDGYAGVGLAFWKNRVRVDVSIDIFSANDVIDYVSLSTGVYKHSGEGASENAEILSSHPDYQELLEQFSLSRIFLEYGSPKEIWVKPFPEDELHRSTYATGSYPFDFVIIYPDKGFAVEYMTRVKDENDGYLTGCPDTAYMKISSWNPERNPQFAEIATYFDGIDSLDASNYSEFKQIQDVTALSVGDFYELYKDLDYSECVKTPRDLWP